MEKDGDSLEEQTNGEEGLFDLSLDDLSPDDIDQDTSKEDPDKEIIELIELVEKGEKDFGESNGEITQSYEDDRPTKELVDAERIGKSLSDSLGASEKEVSFSETDMELANLSLESDLLKGDETDIEAGMGVSVEDEIEKILKEDTDHEIDITVDNVMQPGESPDDLVEEADQEETADDMNMTFQRPLASTETPESVEETIVEKPEKEIEVEPLAGAGDKDIEEIITISDERLEAIVTRVVKDVVERVVRETMAEVAEKVIREAIDALKQSIEKASD